MLGLWISSNGELTMGLKNPVGDRGLHHGVVDLCDLAVYIVV